MFLNVCDMHKKVKQVIPLNPVYLDNSLSPVVINACLQNKEGKIGVGR